MATEKWDDETSALWVAYLNTRHVPVMLVMLIVTAVLEALSVTAIGSDSRTFALAFAAAFAPGGFFAFRYVAHFLSVGSKVRLDAGRNKFFADRKGYRAKIKANPNNPIFKISLQSTLIAAGGTLLACIGIFSGMNG